MKKEKDGSDLGWFQELMLKFFDKIFTHLEKEEIEEENDKIKGVKRINITWIIVLVVVFLVYKFFIK